jgi:Arc/MetJ-type ribon-helix-helix transcriptional regulator
MGRRPIIGERASGPFTMRLSDEYEARIAAYIRRHAIASRSEAVRRLIDEALSADERRARRRLKKD